MSSWFQSDKDDVTAGPSNLSAGLSLPSPESTTVTTKSEPDVYMKPQGDAAFARELELDQNPPDYAEAQRPVCPITYSFSPIDNNAMILLPPSDYPDSRPKYHIQCNMNVFIPSSFITTIRRGGSADGPFVGDFELGIPSRRANFCIRGKDFWVGEVLTASVFKHSKQWEWRFVKKGLFWDYTSAPPYKCYSRDRQILFATFHLGTARRTPGRAAEPNQITVYPDGYEYFDDILISLMIIERMRLCGKGDLHREDEALAGR